MNMKNINLNAIWNPLNDKEKARLLRIVNNWNNGKTKGNRRNEKRVANAFDKLCDHSIRVPMPQVEPTDRQIFAHRETS